MSMTPDVMKIIEAAKARRKAAGNCVADGDWRGYFRTAAERDEFMARAKRCGLNPVIEQ